MNSEMVSSGFIQRIKVLIADEKPYSWAKRLGISQATFNRLWKEGAIPKGDTLLLISEKTGVSIDWLLTGEGPMKLNDEAYQLAENLKNAELSAEQLVNQALTIGRNAEDLNVDLVVRIIKNMSEGRTKTQLAEIDAALLQAAVDTMKRQDKEKREE